MKKKMTIQTLIVVLLFLAGTLLIGQPQQETFDIGDFSTANPDTLEAAFVESQTNEDLVALVKALCWRYRVAEDETVAEPLRTYGQMMLERAKAETMDLEYVDNPEHMLQVLKVIRELGAR